VPLGPADLKQLARRGIPPAEAERQLALLARPARWAALVRACTPGDGIRILAPADLASLPAAAADAALAGRVTTFVPASGAATRMFKDLLAARGAPGGPSAALAEFVAQLPRFAFVPELEHALAARGLRLDEVRARGTYDGLLDALLGEGGLDYARRPKGLLPFHASKRGPRTPLEEHLVEASMVARDSGGRVRAHFTVSPEHLETFRAALDRVRGAIEAEQRVRLEVTFSVQKPSTDTLALDAGGAPFRDAGGALLLRPSGHGALIENLNELAGDLVFVKNVDNVASEAHRASTIEWMRALIGHAARLRARVDDLLGRLDRGDPAAAREGVALATEVFGWPPAGEPTAEWLRGALDRPLRVCGMVPNTGEPGGGPFWVRGPGGEVRPQIVESAEVDPGSPAQRQLLRAGAHFNPVFMALSLRDRHGKPHDLRRFVDDQAVIVTRKSHEGRELVALERPGLWNGAMAAWNTVFVEVPGSVFNPVKTVFDLLRREHQPAE
jgi:hypothetical protein